MTFVLDASVLACWAFADEEHPTANKALERIRSEEAIAPSLLWFEIRNVLMVGERRGRLSSADMMLFLREIGRLAIMLDHKPDEAVILALVRQFQLSVYDASYLELAQREGLPIATIDKALQKAAKALGIALL